MNRQILLSCSLIALSCSAFAAPAPTVAQWEASVHAREQRTTLLREEIKALDTRIEDRIEGLLGALRAIGDSKDTRSKVTRMKRDTIDRLQKTIDYYRQKRATMQEELRRPTWNLTPEQKRNVITKFDERIEKRVAQILAMQQTLPGEKEYDRYKATGSNWYGTTYEVNEDYRQNQRVSARTNQQRDEISAGLRASIARLEQQNRTYRQQSMGSLSDPTTHKALAEEIAKNDALIADRRKQLAGALTSVPAPTRTVGSREAADLDQALKTSIGDLRRDFDTLFARFNAAIPEVSALNSARAQLAAVKARTP